MLNTVLAQKLSIAVRFMVTAFLALSFAVAYPASNAYAKKRKPAKYGTIKIRSAPGGFPIDIDGKPNGITTTEDRSFDLDPGVHTIVLTLPDGHRWTREISLEAGRIKCVALNYRPAPLPATLACPYPVYLSAPSQVNEGEIITYTVDVAYHGNSALNYIWTVNPGNARVLSGKGTSTITVDSTGLSGQRISASVTIDDGSGNAECRQISQATTFVPPLPPRARRESREFDVCDNCSFDDQKARLDNLAVELQNDQSARAHIIAYAGRTSRIGQADRLATRARDYLVTQRGIDGSRITVVNGGFREGDSVELWIVPSGAAPPRSSPTVQAGDVRPPKETQRPRK
jgi:hypothetical protein